MRHSEIRIRVRRIKRRRVQHPKCLAIACRCGAALGIDKCVIELADLQVMLLHDGLARTRRLTGDLLSQAAATGDPESRRRYGAFRAVYDQSIVGPSLDFVAIMESIGERDCEASFLAGEQYQIRWERTSDIEDLRLAFHWLIVSAQLGYVDALVNLGLLLSDLGQRDTACEIWSVAARRGRCFALQELVVALVRKGLCVLAPNATEVLRFVKNVELLALRGADRSAGAWLSMVLRLAGWDIFDLVAAVRMARRTPRFGVDFQGNILVLGEAGPASKSRPWAFTAPHLSKRHLFSAPEFRFEVVAISRNVVELACGIFIPVVAREPQGE